MANFDTKGALAELETISEQIIASQSAGSEGRTFANQSKTYAGKLSDYAEKAAEVTGMQVAEIFAIADQLGKIAEAVGPVAASVEWKSEEVQAKLEVLKQFEKLGLLTDDQVVMLNGFATTLKNTGVRAPRTEADAIEGRPTRIEIKYGNATKGYQTGDMAGNKAQSAGNLANRLGSILGVEDKTSEAYKALKAYANQACLQGETVSIDYTDTEGIAGTLTLTPFEPASE